MLMKKLLTKWVQKWAKKSKITEIQLLGAISNLEDSKSAADLGGGLYKVRMASNNKGKSGGYRSLIVYKKKDRAVIVYGFAKSESDNLDATEKKYFN